MAWVLGRPSPSQAKPQSHGYFPQFLVANVRWLNITVYMCIFIFLIFLASLLVYMSSLPHSATLVPVAHLALLAS